jgi:hypothetical protein
VITKARFNPTSNLNSKRHRVISGSECTDRPVHRGEIKIRTGCEALRSELSRWTASDYGLSEGNDQVRDGTSWLVLDPAYFATLSGPTNVQGMSAGHGQFVFNTTTRTFMWDSDGAVATLSGIALATFNTGTVLSAERFEMRPSDGDPLPPPPPPTVTAANGTPSPQTEVPQLRSASRSRSRHRRVRMCA